MYQLVMTMPLEIICEAVEEKKKLTFHYDGHFRRLQPYVYGQTAGGEDMVKGYQTSGGSASFSNPQWRNFKIEDIEELKLTDEDFSRVRDDYEPDDADFSEMYCQIEK